MSAVCWRARRSIRAAEPSAFATSSRTRSTCFASTRRLPGRGYWTPVRTSTRRATSCTGGTVGAPDKGVRTRISDDLVWLPWAVCEYLDATRDETLLAERVTGIDSEPLRPDEESRYEDARTGAEKSVLEHAAAALRCVLRRGFGAHGLLLMGAGDWCDGFDAVGRAGRRRERLADGVLRAHRAQVRPAAREPGRHALRRRAPKRRQALHKGRRGRLGRSLVQARILR